MYVHEKVQKLIFALKQDFDDVVADDLAQAVDSWRIFPRIFISVYILLLYQVVNWFMNLSDPNTQQAGLVSIVVGAGAAWFGLYTGSSKKFKDK